MYKGRRAARVQRGQRVLIAAEGGTKNRTTGLRPLEMHPFWCWAHLSPGGGTLLFTYLPARHVILSRRRRILVHADSTSSLINTSRKAESGKPIADSR